MTFHAAILCALSAVATQRRRRTNKAQALKAIEYHLNTLLKEVKEKR